MMPSQRTVLVIGGTGGLGSALAHAFQDDENARVVITGANENEVNVARQDERLSSVRVVELDVRDNRAILELMSSIDRLDVLINAAGVMASPTDFTPGGFERTIDINLNGTMRTCLAAEPLLRESQGNIVNFGSMMSFRGSPTGPAYAASKGGVLLLTKSLAAAWGPDIRVNGVAPGFMDTPMTKTIQLDEARNARAMSRVPSGHWGQPEDLVSGIQYLAAPTSTFVTGIMLPIDGGYLTS